MDGQQVGSKYSLQQQLSHWMMLIALVFSLIIALISWVMAFHEARELQDDILQEIASLIVTNKITHTGIFQQKIAENALVFQQLESKTQQTFFWLPQRIKEGLHTLKIGQQEWRVLVFSQPLSAKHFMIAQQTEWRNEIAWNSSLNVFFPILLLMVIMLLVINSTIQRLFKPLSYLTEKLNQQDGTQLNPLVNTGIPDEITPFLHAINGLLLRSQQVMQKQQRFITNAAHELRTPVTALSLLTENLQHATSKIQRQQRQQLLLQGLERLRILVNQLLDLARLQNHYRNSTVIVSFNQLILETIADLYPMAEVKNIDLGMLRQETVTICDQNGSLNQLVRNAIDNAIRYTPYGGKIDVSLFIETKQAVFRVEDTGCGITESELEQVLEPFYCSEKNFQAGNGLGLAISQEIALRLGGRIRLSNRSTGGLQFQYQQPLQT